MIFNLITKLEPATLAPICLALGVFFYFVGLLLLFVSRYHY